MPKAEDSMPEDMKMYIKFWSSVVKSKYVRFKSDILANQAFVISDF